MSDTRIARCGLARWADNFDNLVEAGDGSGDHGGGEHSDDDSDAGGEPNRAIFSSILFSFLSFQFFSRVNTASL